MLVKYVAIIATYIAIIAINIAIIAIYIAMNLRHYNIYCNDTETLQYELQGPWYIAINIDIANWIAIILKYISPIVCWRRRCRRGCASPGRRSRVSSWGACDIIT